MDKINSVIKIIGQKKNVSLKSFDNELEQVISSSPAKSSRDQVSLAIGVFIETSLKEMLKAFVVHKPSQYLEHRFSEVLAAYTSAISLITRASEGDKNSSLALYNSLIETLKLLLGLKIEFDCASISKELSDDFNSAFTSLSSYIHKLGDSIVSDSNEIFTNVENGSFWG